MRFCLLLICSTVAVGCGDFDPLANDEGYDYAGSDAGREPGPDVGVPPPTFEDEAFELGAPTASLNYVWVANRTRGTLAQVDARGGVIRVNTTRVGADPRIVVTAEDQDLAIVLNHASASVTIVRSEEDFDELTSTTVDILPGANRLLLTPNADAALAWYDHRAAALGDVPGDLSTVSFIDVSDAPQVYQISVGLNVRDVLFSDDGAQAFIVTDDGFSQIVLADVTSDGFAPPRSVFDAQDPVALGGDRETLIADAYDVALVREGDSTTLRWLSLVGGPVYTIEVGAQVSDVDLTDAGATAVLSVPAYGALGLLDVAGLQPPEGSGDVPPEGSGDVPPEGSGDMPPELTSLTWLPLDDQPVGQTVISPTGTELLAFSATSGSHFLSIVNVTEQTVRTLNLRKGILNAAIAPDGRTAIVRHTKQVGTPVAGAPESEILAKSYAYSVVDLASGQTKLIRTDAQPGALVFTPDGQAAYIIVTDGDAVRDVEWIDLATFRNGRVSFAKVPETLGILPSVNAVFVSQVHTLGRIAFVDAVSREVRELTGFELNSLID